MANFSISYVYTIKDNMSPTLQKITKEVNKQKKAMESQDKTINRMVKSENRFTSALKRSLAVARKLDQSLRFSVEDVMNVGARLAVIAFPIKKAIDFESAMAGVAKAAGFSRGDEQYEKTKKQILDLMDILPQSETEIAAMFEQGSKLGIKGDQLNDFAKLVAKAGVSFDMTGDVAAEVLGSMKAKMGLSIKEVEHMMDAVNHLENKTSTSGDAIINVLSRISGTVSLIELKPAQAAGLAAFAAEVEKSPELAASGINMMVRRMQKMPGMTAKLLKDPQAAIQGVLKDIAKLPKELQAARIDKLFGAEAGRFVAKAVGQLKRFEQDMAYVANPDQYFGSMDREFNEKMDTTAMAIKKLRNALVKIAIGIGDAFLPAIKMTTFMLTYLAHAFMFVMDWTGPLIPAIFAIVTALYAVVLVDKLLIGTKTSLTGVWKNFKAVVAKTVKVLWKMVNGTYASAAADTFAAKRKAIWTWVCKAAAATAAFFSKNLTRSRLSMLALNIAVVANTIAQAVWSRATKAAAVTAAFFSGILKKVRFAMLTLNLAMMANPVGFIVAGVMALVAGLVALASQLDVVKNAWGSFVDSAKAFFKFGDANLTQNTTMQEGDNSSKSILEGKLDVNMKADGATVTSVDTKGNNITSRPNVSYGSASTGNQP